ncbi:hypothetical protein ACE83Q_02940 [Dellaglioa sp. P0083]|uniref:hypothetical protein n=1 Tax=Dellaglioa kimchii TaxID=3344667 RepID=UPI0038D4BC44
MKLLWNTYWKMILGIFVVLMVISFVFAIALYVVFIVALVFAIRYVVDYRKIDRKDVTKVPAPFYKKWWFYALIISFLFILISAASSNSNNSTSPSSKLESKDLKLSFDSKKIKTNDKGVATITGTTEKGASVVAGVVHSDTADDAGAFSLTYPLTSASEKTINVTATSKDGTSKVLKVTIIPSKSFSNAEHLKSESENKVSSEESPKNSSLIKVNKYLNNSLKEDKKFAESNESYGYTRYIHSIQFKNSSFDDLQVTVFKDYLELSKSKRKEVMNTVKGSAIAAAMLSDVNQKAIDKMNSDGLAVSLKFY